MHLMSSKIRAGLCATAAGFLAILAGVSGAHASSAEEWQAFQDKVKAACLAAAQPALTVKTINIDPYGSESYGFAILLGTTAGSDTQRVMVCAFNKQSEAAEVSTVFE